MGYNHVEEIAYLEENKVEGKRLGRHVRHDSRSKQYRVAPAAAAPVSIEHKRMIPVFDQGDLGSCTGNASVGAVGCSPLFDALPANHPILDEALAVKVYSAATRLDSFPGTYLPTDTGSDGLSAAKALKALGLIAGYTHALSLDDVIAALQTTPVIVGVGWYEGFDNPDARGFVSISGKVRGGHEFLIVGVDMERKELIACNSWGESWGDKGYFRFSFADFQRLLDEQGDATVLLPLSEPAPVPTPPAPTPTPTPVPTSDADATFAAVLKPWALGRSCRTKAIKAAAREWLTARGF